MRNLTVGTIIIFLKVCYEIHFTFMDFSSVTIFLGSKKRSKRVIIGIIHEPKVTSTIYLKNVSFFSKCFIVFPCVLTVKAKIKCIQA